MNVYRIMVLLVAASASCICAFGSEEEYVEWDQVKIASAGYKETGKIYFEAKTDGRSYNSISIKAFGKEFKISGKNLAKFKGFPLNSLSITHEAGYQSTGGHTVHVRMKRLYYLSSRLVEELIRISISKNKGIVITGPEIKEAKK